MLINSGWQRGCPQMSQEAPANSQSHLLTQHEQFHDHTHSIKNRVAAATTRAAQQPHMQLVRKLTSHKSEDASPGYSFHLWSSFLLIHGEAADGPNPWALVTHVGDQDAVPDVHR